MPGIAALVTKMPRAQAVEQLTGMVETLRHESFYTTGTWIDESLGIYVGWTAQENCFSDGMPLRNEQGDVALVFSGEEYPEPGTAQRLRARGHELDGVGASHLVHLYEDDSSFPAGLNGRFHGLLVDQRRGIAILFNDRYGMHRVYYHESKEAVYFCVEAKAILAARPETRRMDSRALGEFIACGCVLENRTLFEGVHLLPPASAWILRNGSVERKRSYFDPKEWEDQQTLEPESYYKELRRVFTRNLPRYFNGHQRVAMSLTGGLDTRMIMALRRPQPGSLPCYTFGGTLRECQDVIVARQVARALEQPHDVIGLEDEFFSRFSHYAERVVYLADGCVEVSRAPDLYLNSKAREIAPVRVTGLYGGEVLRGVRAFKPEDPPPGLRTPDFLCHILQARETYASIVHGHPISFAVFKQAPWCQYGSLAIEETQLSLRSPFLDNDLVQTVFRAPKSAVGTSSVSLQLVADGNKALLRIPTDRGLGGAVGCLSEAASRARLEFLFKAEYAYDVGMPQSVARLDHVLRTLRLERLFLGRHKIFHFRIWYKNALSQYVREMLLDPRTLSRPYVQRRSLESMVAGHLRGDRNYTSEIHKVLTLELSHRLFLDRK